VPNEPVEKSRHARMRATPFGSGIYYSAKDDVKKTDVTKLLEGAS